MSRSDTRPSRFDRSRTRTAGAAGFATGEVQVHDLLADLNATNGQPTDKPEGTAIMPGRDTYVITDNDGVDGLFGG